MHKAGFVSIIGKPNAGKSTLLNKMMGEKLAIVSAKAQTTRHRIFGIYNDIEHQIVFSDTPGILKPHYKLQEKMMDAVEASLSDADVFLFVVDISDKEFANSDSPLLDKIKHRFLHTPENVILVLNKLDLSSQDELASAALTLNTPFPGLRIFPVSALTGFGIPELFSNIKEMLPEHPPYFDKESISDRPVRFFMAEIIREKILLFYQQEIPYAVEVTIEAYTEEPTIHRIEAVIYVARESQKGILIGKGGSALKKIGTEARKDMETFLENKVFLQLFVKVRKNWRDDPRALSEYGY
jgi:GTP-binding protein Era